jgi:signal transduction histidine kinase
MIIEDEPDSAALLEDILSEANYRTVWHKDAMDALGALDKQVELPDLILLDLMMPRMDGWTFRVEQRKRSAISDIPVAAMSADHSSKALAINAEVFLTKPFACEQIVPAIENALLTHERRKLTAKGLEMERLRSLGMLLGSVSHELANPLQYITGFLSLASRDCAQLGDSATPVRRSIDAAIGAAETMSHIVKDLRVFARAESRERSADLVHAVEGALRLADPVIRFKAHVVSHFERGMPHVVGNEARLSQVFLNLLMNAAQAIEDGTPARQAITVTARREGDHALVEVADTGCGMTAEVLSRVFEPFFTTKPAEEGTGIGLSFSREVIEEYGGAISAESQVGRGSIFRVELQFEDRHEHTPHSA